MKKNYTITNLKALQALPKLDTVQFTLNGHTFPSKRRTVEMMKELLPYHDAKVIVHYDFIYIASRYVMFTEEVRNAITDELSSILSYADENNSVLGVVMHTDGPIAKEVLEGKKRVEDHYSGSLWNTKLIADNIKDWDDTLHVISDSIQLLYRDMRLKYNGNSKIFLENTTKCPKGVDMVDWLIDTIEFYELTDLFGICIDTEHAFAVTGKTLTNCEKYIFHCSDIHFMFHVNAIPAIVKPQSHKDRHSETTIFDCSHYTPEQYFKFTDLLDQHNIPWVREVHEETMYDEFKKLRELSLKKDIVS